MPNVAWAPNSRRDLLRLAAFLLPRNPDAARRAVLTIRERVKLLEAQPAIGRPVAGMSVEYREWMVPFGGNSYVVFYYYDGRAVTVLSVRHGRERGYVSP